MDFPPRKKIRISVMS